MKGVKKSNRYQGLISQSAYENIPKSVFAAIAVSYLLNHQNVNAENLELDLLREWQILHYQGIVPQKPKNLNSKKIKL